MNRLSNNFFVFTMEIAADHIFNNISGTCYKSPKTTLQDNLFLLLLKKYNSWYNALSTYRVSINFL